MTDPGAAATRRLVWDAPTRLFHWLFAASILLSWLTAELGVTWMKWHLRLGYLALGLLVFRLVWGFIGPRHARFASFVRGPRALLHYLRQDATSAVTPGHNPLGALMVLFMLLLGVIQVGTGLFASDDIAWAGPYNASVTGSTASWLTRLHDLNFNVWLGAITLHVAAIAYYRAAKGHRLVTPMITGWKDARLVPDGQAIRDSQWLKATALAALSGVLIALLLRWAPAPVSSDGY